MIPAKESNPGGLHMKYLIFDIEKQEFVNFDAFVLKMESLDPDRPMSKNAYTLAAWSAILCYADHIEYTNAKLAEDLRNWVEKLKND